MQGSAQLGEHQLWSSVVRDYGKAKRFTISAVRVGAVMQKDRFNIYFSWHLKLEHVDFNFNGLEQSKIDIP
jgi:hypothetical protein